MERQAFRKDSAKDNLIQVLMPPMDRPMYPQHEPLTGGRSKFQIKFRLL